MYLTKNIYSLNKLISSQPQKLIQIGSLNLSQFTTDSSAAPAENHLSTSTGVPDKLYKKIEIELRGNEPAVLKSYSIFTTATADNLGLKITRNTTPKKPVMERYTVLKSAFVHKDHRVQYEFRTHYRFIDFEKLTGSTADTLLEYLQRNLPEGVAMKVTKHEITRFPEAVREPPQQPTLS